VKTTKTTRLVVCCYKQDIEVVNIKGPNPFTPWEDKPGNIYGRKDESIIFKAFLNAASSKQPGVLIVTAIPGLGKTSLMRYFKGLAEKEGMFAPFVKAEKGESMEVVVDKLYHEILTVPGSFGIGKKAPASFDELVKRLRLGTRYFGVVFFIDDIDNMKKAEDEIMRLTESLKSVWKKKNISFVLSSTKEFRIKSDVVRTVVLKPLDEHDARAFVEKSLKESKLKMGEECRRSIMNDTQGNPRLFKSVCRYIYDRLRDDEKIMTKRHYLAYLPYIMGMFSREWFGRMYQETPPAEREILIVLAKNEEGMHVSDIAEELGKPLGPVTALTRRLLDRGQIIKLGRGKYRIFAKLYAKYVMQRA